MLIFLYTPQGANMKKLISLILLVVLISLAFIVSCDASATKGPSNQVLSISSDFWVSLEDYFGRLVDCYSQYSSVDKKLTEDEFRALCDYKVSLYPEIGTFEDKTTVSEITFGNTSFSPEDKVTMRMGEKAIVEGEAFKQDGYYFNGSAPVLLLELLCGETVIEVDGMPTFVEGVPETKDITITGYSWPEGKGVLSTLDNEVYIIRNVDRSPDNCLQIKFNTAASYFVTKALCFNEDQTMNTIYGFAKSEDNMLKIYPFRDDPDCDTVIYTVCIRDNNGDYHKEVFVISFT